MAEYATYHKNFSIGVSKIIIPIHILTDEYPIPTSQNCFEAVWDTGATNTCISPHLANTMKLKSIGETSIEGFTGFSNSLLFKSDLLLPNNIVFRDHLFFGSGLGSVDMLLGMDVISKCNSSIISKENGIDFSFEIPIIKNNEYDLYEEPDQEN